MKKKILYIILGLLLFIGATSVGYYCTGDNITEIEVSDVDDEFLKQSIVKMYECETQQKEFLSKEDNFTNSQMMKSSYNLTGCYVYIFNNVIDKFYSKRAKEVKENFNNFLKNSYVITSNINQAHDDCPCGTISNLLYTYDTSQIVKNMLVKSIRTADFIHHND